ncbi:MAG TPA: redox-sensing transcriptional repressor Rex [Candidatus Nanopelagicales bacterium]|nr:redox-sensing transcriptional repressor Rex [Candidatus Nanopelagicales bacterium]
MPLPEPLPKPLPSAHAPSPRNSGRGIPEATVARLPVYHRVLTAIAEAGTITVSSEELASACGVTSAKLRKDLSYLGSYGTRGVGYDVAFLSYQIARELGLTSPWGVVVVGLGNLGRALVSYRGFATRGFTVVGLIDAHPDVIGSRVQVADREITVRPPEDLSDVVGASDAHIGVITTPAEAAQEVADRFVSAGVRSIVNFAPVVLNVPDGVEVRKVDLAVELQVLAFHEQRRRQPEGSVVTSLDPARPTPASPQAEAMNA